jgi:broad specificity phosphatase PhoE
VYFPAMQVILVRHGQTDWNQEGIFRGRIDVKLNAAGIDEAGIIGAKLSGVDPDAVYSSPLSRALETARSIASFRDKRVTILDELVDFDFGAWQGLSREEAKARYPRVFAKWEKTPEKARIPGAETLDGVRKRVLGGLDSIRAAHPDGKVVIVSHGLINKVLLCAVLGLANSNFWKIKQDNGAISIFTYSSRGTKLVLLNDTTHLRSVDEIVAGMKSPENPLG